MNIFFWAALIGSAANILWESWSRRWDTRVACLMLSFLALHLITIYLLMRG